jgi:hypothetical protein
MAYTGDSNAPLRDVKRVQFGILGPDEVVRFVFIMLFSYSNSINLLFVLCVSVLFKGLANVIEFYTRVNKKYVIECKLVRVKNLEKKGGCVASDKRCWLHYNSILWRRPITFSIKNILRI